MAVPHRSGKEHKPRGHARNEHDRPRSEPLGKQRDHLDTVSVGDAPDALRRLRYPGGPTVFCLKDVPAPDDTISELAGHTQREFLWFREVAPAWSWPLR